MGGLRVIFLPDVVTAYEAGSHNYDYGNKIINARTILTTVRNGRVCIHI